eukprot:8622788-Pyramimonas_sp.AAC.1
MRTSCRNAALPWRLFRSVSTIATSCVARSSSQNITGGIAECVERNAPRVYKVRVVRRSCVAVSSFQNTSMESWTHRGRNASRVCKERVASGSCVVVTLTPGGSGRPGKRAN